MTRTLKFVLSVLAILALAGCKEDSALGPASTAFPPQQFGYELMEVIGTPHRGDRIVSMQGYPKQTQVVLDFRGHEFRGDPSREYLIHAYDDSGEERVGYIVYAKNEASLVD